MALSGISDWHSRVALEELFEKTDHTAGLATMNIQAALYAGTATDIDCAQTDFATASPPAGIGSEGSGGGYDREPITWTAAASERVDNGSNPVTFTEATAGGYGNDPFNTFAIVDSATTNSVIALDTNAQALTVNEGDQPQYGNDALAITLAQTGGSDGLTTDAANRCLNLLTQQGVGTTDVNGLSAGRWLGFTTADPTTTGNFTGEPNGADNYARQSLTGSSWSNGSTAGGVTTITYNAAITFTPGATWTGTFTHWFIADSAADLGGTMVAYGPIAGGSKTINSGDDVSIASGQVSVTFTTQA